MSFADKMVLGANTTVIGMGIVFLVLIFLSVVIAVQSKVVAAFFKGTPKNEPEPHVDPVVAPAPTADKSGAVSGETVLVGVEDEETVALIMAVVSHHVNIPLSELKIKSIKAV